MGRCWHPDCFRCTCCNKVFDRMHSSVFHNCQLQWSSVSLRATHGASPAPTPSVLPTGTSSVFPWFFSIKYTPTSKCVTTTTCTHTDTPSRPAPPSSPVTNTTTTTTTTTTGTPSSPYYSHTTKTTSTTTTVQPSTSRSSFSKPPPRVPSIHSSPVTLANSSEQTVSESIHEPAMDPMESPISPSPASPKPGTSSVQTYKKTVTITTTEAILCPNCNTPHLSNATACTTCGYKFNQDGILWISCLWIENEFNMIQEHIKSIPDNELPIYPYSQLIVLLFLPLFIDLVSSLSCQCRYLKKRVPPGSRRVPEAFRIQLWGFQEVASVETEGFEKEIKALLISLLRRTPACTYLFIIMRYHWLSCFVAEKEIHFHLTQTQFKSQILITETIAMLSFEWIFMNRSKNTWLKGKHMYFRTYELILFTLDFHFIILDFYHDFHDQIQIYVIPKKTVFVVFFWKKMLRNISLVLLFIFEKFFV